MGLHHYLFLKDNFWRYQEILWYHPVSLDSRIRRFYFRCKLLAKNSKRVVSIYDTLHKYYIHFIDFHLLSEMFRRWLLEAKQYGFKSIYKCDHISTYKNFEIVESITAFCSQDSLTLSEGGSLKIFCKGFSSFLSSQNS